MTPDIFNGLFELGGALFIVGHIVRLHRDKLVRGVYWPAVAFFALWGYWNLYYYAALEQPVSWLAGLCVTISNSIWLGQMLYWLRRERVIDPSRLNDYVVVEHHKC